MFLQLFADEILRQNEWRQDKHFVLKCGPAMADALRSELLKVYKESNHFTTQPEIPIEDIKFTQIYLPQGFYLQLESSPLPGYTITPKPKEE